MQLSELFNAELMDLGSSFSNQHEVLKHVADMLQKKGVLSDKDSYIKALEKREQQSTTGIGEGIAIPHAQHHTITSPTIVFVRSQEGIDWQSLDGEPVRMIFAIAAPEKGGQSHLKALSKLSSVLMKKDAQVGLMNAETPEEVLRIISRYTSPNTDNQSGDIHQHHADHVEEAPYIVAVTACPTGIAHTFMAEEKLTAAAKEAGYEIKVETNGQSGVEHRLTSDDIKRARAVIVAADKQVSMARFDGKPLLNCKVSDGIHKADELVAKAAQGDAPIYHADQSDSSNNHQATQSESWSRQFYKHLMNGVSHMLPFVVAGGILIALSFAWGIYAADITHPSYNEWAHMLNVIGGMSFAMMLPMLSGFIGQSIADRPGLVVGFMGGVFANPSILSSFSQEGLLESVESSGFLGALVAGFLAGGIIWVLKKIFAWIPKSLDGLKPIFIFPVFGVLLIGMVMLFVVNAPMAWVMQTIMTLLNTIPREYSIVLGFVVAAMMSIDMGGPINKAAYVTGTALISSSGGAGSNVMASVMIGGMVPPLAIALSATIWPKLWNAQERQGAYVNYVMGAAFITEGAIPFAASRPLRVIPSLAIGSGIAGALSMFFGSVSYVPHGGVFAIIVGGVTHPLMYIMSWIIGGIIGAILLKLSLSHHR